MIMYTQTPDYYNDYIKHGWAKDAAAKVHKYIERWRGKNGKWIYKYKTSTTSGRPNSSIDIESKSNVLSGIEAGRKRSVNIGNKIKGYIGNLRNRGFSNSKTSGSKGYTGTWESVYSGRRRFAKVQGHSGNLRRRGYSDSKNGGSDGYTGSWGSVYEGRKRAKVSRAKKDNEKYKKQGNKGNLRDKGYSNSTTGNYQENVSTGYTMTNNSVYSGRRRAIYSKNTKLQEEGKLNPKHSRKKKVISGSASIKRRGLADSDKEAYINNQIALYNWKANNLKKDKFENKLAKNINNINKRKQKRH